MVGGNATRGEGKLMRSASGLLLLGLACGATAQDLAIYDDALRNGFLNYSYGPANTIDFANPTPFRNGAPSIRLSPDNFNAVAFAHPTQDFAVAQFTAVRFYVHGGATGGQQLEIALEIGDPSVTVASADLDTYIAGGAIVANAWTLVEVQFAGAPLSFAGSFDRINIASDVAGTQGVLYIDDVTLLEATPDIFTDGFEGDAVPVANLLVQEQAVVVGAMTSDRFTWRDSFDLPRVAVLAHNDGQVGPTAGVYANRGGALREFRYRLPGNIERVVVPNTSGNTGFGGFGYIVSHRAEGGAGGIGDDSPLGYSIPGSFQRIATGRHHALFRFTQDYPRHSTTTAIPASTRYDVPITIDWFFATGRDHPLWAVTYDLGAADPVGLDANELNDDSRAPYGELMFDGAATEAARSLTAGVAWGDRFKFATTPDAGPVTYNSAWTWSVPNTVPYVKLWTSAVDATMGVVQTQTIVQHDAGGYFGTSEWGDTSATVPLACTIVRGGIDTTMPCDYNWPYQSINYEMNHFGNPNNTTRSNKLAWGANFGFLGRTAYPIHGSSHPEIGGPIAGDPTASGWPRQSYSTFVVLGRHSDDPVGVQVAEIEAVQQTTLSAVTGAVATQGIAGPGRLDNATYQPVGWDHVYGVWTVDAAANAASVNFAIAGGRSLENPVLRLRNWQGANLPAQVSLNSILLVQDVDYFPSVFDARDELLITLDRTLAGATNQIVITP